MVNNKQSEKDTKLLAVIRIRGRPSINPTARTTLKLLRLHRKNHLVLVKGTPEILGMLQKVKDFVTWGEISLDTLENLLKTRGRLVGNKKLTDENIAKVTPFKTIRDFAKALYDCQVKMTDFPALKPVFRLNSPSGGFKKSIKRPYSDKGELGYRGESINESIERMI